MMALPFVLNDVWPMLKNLAIGTDNSNVVIIFKFLRQPVKGEMEKLFLEIIF
jgi:hypothetical protein